MVFLPSFSVFIESRTSSWALEPTFHARPFLFYKRDACFAGASPRLPSKGISFRCRTGPMAPYAYIHLTQVKQQRDSIGRGGKHCARLSYSGDSASLDSCSGEGSGTGAAELQWARSSLLSKKARMALAVG